MPLNNETLIDTNNSVSTEDRFKLRKFLEQYIVEVNLGKIEAYSAKLSDSLTVHGFQDYVILKPQFLKRLADHFTKKHNFVRLPKVRGSFSRYMFHLLGTYEEFEDNIIVTEGSIELYLIKKDQSFEIVKIEFFPRMLVNEE